MSIRLIDKIRVEVRAGKGGDGIVAYAAHKLKRLVGPGLPSGGNGGSGGDVSVVAKSTVRSLGSIQPVIMAAAGGHGGKARMNGSPGQPAVIKVPVGVAVYCTDSGRLVADLDKPDQSVVVAIGGTGGRGNNMARPHERTKGEPGGSARLTLELKTIADIGLVGFPNAGKSSLVQFLSKATPKIASYPFTTLAPFIGTVGLPDGQSVKVADLPGLVEEAHLNRGMGHEFLRHIERTKALLFVLDSTCQHWNPRETGLMGEGDLGKVLSVLRDEVRLYDASLAAKPWAVVVNKLDTEGEGLFERVTAVDALDRRIRESNEEGFRGLVGVSAKHGIGRKALVDVIARLMQ